MKQILLFTIIIFLFTACGQNEDPVIHQETGTVLNYAGAEHCSIVIELDNGQKILPHYFPEGFVFVNGQRLLLSYTSLPNVISTCGKGIVSEIIHVEEISCGAPLTEFDPERHNVLENDPVFMHQVSLVDDCLFLKVSFSGGCRHHTFDLIVINDEAAKEDIPVLELRHNSNGDVCEAALTTDLHFSLSTLKEMGYTRFYFKAFLEYGETYIELLELE